jgi:hypothetical protein
MTHPNCQYVYNNKNNCPLCAHLTFTLHEVSSLCCFMTIYMPMPCRQPIISRCRTATTALLIRIYGKPFFVELLPNNLTNRNIMLYHCSWCIYSQTTFLRQYSDNDVLVRFCGTFCRILHLKRTDGNYL